MTEHTNSNGALPSLPNTRIKAAELFIENFQRREDELDRVKDELAEAQIRISEQEAEIEALKRERLILESRATSCTMERDRAKDDQVGLATILNSIQHLLQQAGIPSLARQAQIAAEAERGAAE